MADTEKLPQVVITRTETGDEGTFGKLTTNHDGGFECYTGELPDRNNEPNKSCIPAGVYKVVWADHPKHSWCYELLKVKGRTAILIHGGNWVGDADRGLKVQAAGCICLGRAIGTLVGQKALLSSKDAVNGFAEHMEKQSFELTIKNEYRGQA